MSNHRRLSKTSLAYLHILYIIWSLIDYYSTLFGIVPEDNPAEMENSIFQRDGVSFVRFKFAVCDPRMDREYSSAEMADILRQFLNYDLLPGDRILRPYKGGSSVYDICEALYIDGVTQLDGVWRIDVAYVDSLRAFKYVKNSKRLNGGHI